MNATGIDRLTEEIEDFLDSGRWTVDGNKVTTEIRNVERDGGHIRIFLYLPASDNSATITKVELIDDRGYVIDEKSDVLDKEARKGKMVAFDYTIEEV